MKNERLKKYLPLFISIFMLVSFLGLTFGGLILAVMGDMEYFYNYYKLDKWGFTISGLKLFWVVTVFVAWGAWFWLGVLVERIFKVQIFRRSLLSLPPKKRINLLRVINRKPKIKG